MGADQDLTIPEFPEVIVGNDLQTFLFEPVHLLIVVHDVPQAIQLPGIIKFVLSHLDGVNHTKTKT